ncbi:GntR family transcriptional regulator [Streptomyces violaceoruber]|uniref:GntR-family transcriptional regulator n=3 Tax=Streptomyces TaxID=1883 RepID=Q9FBS4_STRCO|nr:MULTISPECIES: GntR family transcriptional regulator [Streptomyces]QSJ07215.1 GntR family transcriptional regulator [Streptomyces lividans]AIJ11711.1 GntR family transcriptional regulator [Streptomyces lividans TK24]EFD65038.1 GntR family transcriptional regulator [Streptomyces lividans TK24]EOY52088.1 GntR family DNA-binding regulator [Streptomyces lividans 1326]KKD12626.1 GntR family transcriptional regulator [Streptomyces sp. WM6391]
MAGVGEPLTRVLLSDQVYTRVRGLIVNGDLKAGDRLVEAEIARDLGVSQAPVREAVKRLVHEGLADHIPRRGSFVADVSSQDADAARAVRVIIEEFAARAVAERADPESVDALRAKVQDMREAAEAGDIGRFRDADIAFHRILCEASANPFLSRIWSLMEPSLRALRVVSDPMFTGDWAEMAVQHGVLLETLESADADRAAAAFAAHARGDEGVLGHGHDHGHG